MHNYPSDISRGQFELIRAELEQAKHKTKLRKYDLYDIFCAVLYVLLGGVQWRITILKFAPSKTNKELVSVHIKSESKIKAREIVEIKIESSLS